MSEKKFYMDEIVKMISSIRNTEWLNSIYSFVKVFADDKEDAS